MSDTLIKRLASLRRYLKDNIRHMEKHAERAGSDGLRIYWHNGARKLKAHLETVKAIKP